VIGVDGLASSLDPAPRTKRRYGGAALRWSWSVVASGFSQLAGSPPTSLPCEKHDCWVERHIREFVEPEIINWVRRFISLFGSCLDTSPIKLQGAHATHATWTFSLAVTGTQ
jgi:hypothetical protein